MPEAVAPGEDGGRQVLGRGDRDARRLPHRAAGREQPRPAAGQEQPRRTRQPAGLSEPAASDPAAGAGESPGSLTDRVRAAAGGLEPLVAQAEAVQRDRAAAAKERGAPRWTDVFTTQFTEFSNRPR